MAPLGLLSIRLKFALDRGALLHVVTTTEKFLQPDVQTDEKISAAHLVDFELGFAGFAVTPSHGDHCPGVTADDRFEWNFYRQIEMGRNQRPAPIDGGFPISFERVGCVVELNVEDQLQKPICKPVYPELQPGIIDDATTFQESAAKYTVPPFVEFLPISNDIAAVVGLIRHHNDSGVSRHAIQSMNNRPAKTV